MEVIYTKYSPGEIVSWERTDRKGIFMRSEETIDSIRVDCHRTYKFKTLEGKREYIRGVYYAFASGIVGIFNSGHSQKASQLAHISNQSFKKVRQKGELRPSGMSHKITYFLKGNSKPIPEEELIEIPITKAEKPTK